MLSLCAGEEFPSGNTGRNRTVTHFDKTALNIHRVLFSVHRRVTQRSRFQRRNNGRMPGENRKRTDHSRQCDNLHISVEYALSGDTILKCSSFIMLSFYFLLPVPAISYLSLLPPQWFRHSRKPVREDNPLLLPESS